MMRFFAGARLGLLTWVMVACLPGSGSTTGGEVAISRGSVDPTFVLVSGPPGTDTGRARGVAWGDLDGDGFPELYVTRGRGFPNTLYTNVAGRLVASQDRPTSFDAGDSEGATFVDFDGDGDLDLHAVARNGGAGLLFENLGAGKLTRLRGTPIAPDSMSASMACWGDVDADGQLDVFILGYRAGRSRLFRGRSGQFEAVTLPASADLHGNGRACGWGDPNDDGLPDLAIAVAQAPNVILMNRGDFAFSPIELPELSRDSAYSYGVSWVDADQDGLQDLFFANFDGANVLYRQTAPGAWEKSPWGARLASPASKGHAWGDYDLDGTLDLYLSSGTPAPAQFDFLYLGDGVGRWRADSLGEFATLADTNAGAAWADMDADGDLDLFVASWGSPGSVSRLYRNSSAEKKPAAGWLKIQLRGQRSNTMGIGARASLLVTSAAEGRWQHRSLSSNTGYAGQNEPLIHFGLGTGSADSLVIRWPSGRIDAFGPLTPRRTYRAEEGRPGLTTLRDTR